MSDLNKSPVTQVDIANNSIFESYLDSLFSEADFSLSNNIEIVNTNIINKEKPEETEFWGLHAFKAITISVPGSTIILPLNTLRTIFKNKSSLSNIVYQNKIFKLVNNINWHDKVDASRAAASTDNDLRPYTILFDMGWGMHCNILNHMIIDPSDIYWRKSTETLPWVLGIYKPSMLSIISVENIPIRLK